MRKSIIVILLLQILTFNLFSQSQPASTGEARASYGLFGHFNLNQHSADFQKLPGVPNCCPKFESGSGTGFTIGLLYELPLSDDLQLGLRLGYSSIGGELKKTEPVTIIKSGTPQAGEFEHTLNASLSNIGIEPLIGWRLFNNFTIHAGFRAGYALTGKYGQVETIVKPASGATFLDSLGNDTHSRTRNAFSGDLKDASTLYLSAIGGISYELPLNSDETLMLVPEAFYSFGLTPVVKDLKWDVSSIRAGLAIKYSPIYRIIEKQKGKEQIDTVIISSPAIAQKTFKTGMPRIETETLYSGNKKIIIENYIRTDTIINPKQYLLTASIDVLGVDSSGNEIPNPEFLVEEFISTGMHPLLNYIFFDDNSSSIPSRYNLLSNSDADNFYYSKLYNVDALTIYYQILNVIGRRLKDNPDANLKVVGCNSNIKEEKNNISLSRKRAESVKGYLTSVWGISDKRIKIEVRNLPAKASTPIDEPDKIEENRRVELYSNTNSILEPVVTKDTLYIIKPELTRFKLSVKSEAGLKKWQLDAFITNQLATSESQNSIFRKNGIDDVPEIIDWVLADNSFQIFKSKQKINYKLSVDDLSKQNIESNVQNLKIKFRTIEQKKIERLADKEIDRYSLILFDFDKSEIIDENLRIVNFIKSRIKPNSNVKISGYTDRTGDVDYDRELSLKRARSAANILKQPNSEVLGLGRDFLLYNNDIPEGRFYCRTVNITVETPIK